MEALVNTHTGYFIRPTLQEEVQGWLSFHSVNYTKREAAQQIMATRLNRENSYGHGNKAAKREGVLSTMSDHCLREAMQVRQGRENKRMATLLAYDSATEARTFPTNPNPHDD